MWHQTLWSLKKTKQVRHIIYTRGSWDKVLEPVVQCDVPAVKNTSLDDDDDDDDDNDNNDDCK